MQVPCKDPQHLVHAIALRTIKSYSNLEQEFLVQFFKDETEVSVHSFPKTKQREGETVKTFIEIFRDLSMQCLHDMTKGLL